jgi:hypothetical protein
LAPGAAVAVAGASARVLAAGFKAFDTGQAGAAPAANAAHAAARAAAATAAAAAPLLIEQNFEDRGLRPPLFACADAATLPQAVRPLLVSARRGADAAPDAVSWFDAIVTDPPYGKREWLGGQQVHM